jgi:hypothetical protein
VTTIDKLHNQARQAIESGESKFRDAAEYLAKAEKLGATQRQSAIGKSVMWVNGLLKWRNGGYKTVCPFPNPRYSGSGVQSTVQKKKPNRPGRRQALSRRKRKPRRLKRSGPGPKRKKPRLKHQEPAPKQRKRVKKLQRDFTMRLAAYSEAVEKRRKSTAGRVSF